MAITAFRGDHEFLSNFYRCPMKVDGLEYATLEHAFQAAKATSDEMRETIRLAGTPGRAKHLGRTVELPADWEQRRIDVMRQLLAIKFAIPEMREALLATGEETLIEGNQHRDRFWGAEEEHGTWVGENHLGILLMELRHSLQGEEKPKAKRSTKA